MSPCEDILCKDHIICTAGMTTIQKKYSSCERLKIAVEYDSEKSSVSLSDQITAHSLPLRETDESSKILRWNVLEEFLNPATKFNNVRGKKYWQKIVVHDKVHMWVQKSYW
ncbi:hypothetical protein PV328_010370 [Microctonus aethiopoides]|uniref:Uncharacterized protein n=1 Tax=Microctonus aethiopoides TaxID=144406 RepID=A0AA39FHX1_9HYME|nr:hypothetical protein PV328_010370 [Microctonus aethiopoides]